MDIKSVIQLIDTMAMPLRRKRWLSRQHSKLNASKDIERKAKSLGFTADEYIIYDLEHNDPKEYLSEFERALYRKKVAGSYKILLDNKIVFYNIMRNFAPVNKIYAYSQCNHIYWLECGFSSIKELVKNNKIIVYKKISGGCGDGFALLEYKDNNFYINRKEVTSETFDQLFDSNDDYLLEEYCKQSDFEDKLFPYAVNTLRIATLEKNYGEIVPIFAFQRMGVKANSCVDNASAGGLFSSINMETGILSSAVCNYDSDFMDKSGGVVRFDIHPVTGTRIEGQKIPDWETILSSVVNLHKQILFTKISFIAWDIALTNDGFKVIEGNATCSMDFLQRETGHRKKLLGELYRKKGIIK